MLKKLLDKTTDFLSHYQTNDLQIQQLKNLYLNCEKSSEEIIFALLRIHFQWLKDIKLNDNVYLDLNIDDEDFCMDFRRCIQDVFNIDVSTKDWSSIKTVSDIVKVVKTCTVKNKPDFRA